MRHINRKRVASWLPVVLAIALGNASCAIRLVADYNEQIDRTATVLQQEMDAHLTNLQLLGANPQADYSAQKQFYADYGVKLRSVRVRALGLDKNQITVDQLDGMAESLESLRALHEQQGKVSSEFANTSRELFNTGWAAIIKWEMAKRRHT